MVRGGVRCGGGKAGNSAVVCSITAYADELLDELDRWSVGQIRLRPCSELDWPF
ncbi:MAG: hypothetical protein CM1200mP41_00640 [Gammaproteobacteria bacterium]|nr:MAG: hypothetical protein CM1200mP41_00640 [Gammaproteobacteria bacterium]